MSKLSITARKRPLGTKGTLAALRREGKVPAVVYGLKNEPETVEVLGTELRPVLAHRNAIIDLNVDGATQKVMLKQLDRDPIRGDYIHADFIRVDDEHPVTVSVPVIPEGIPVGVKTGGGIFSVAKKFVRLRAKIQDIPDTFTIDVSDLQNGQTFYVKDLKFEKGSFVTPPRTALFGVSEGRKTEEAATPAAAAPAAAADKKAGDDKKAAGGKK